MLKIFYYSYDKPVLNNLKVIGYKSKNKISMIKAFQRRFRQKLISSKIDKECLFIAISLVKNNNY